MTQRVREVFIFLLLTAVAVSGHLLIQRSLFSYAPAPLVLATLCAWLLPRRWHWPLLIVAVSELFSSLPAGGIALAVVVPYVVWRLRGTVEINLSVAFFALLALTSALQFAALAFSSMLALPLLEGIPLFAAFPWQPFLWGTATSTLLTFTVCQALQGRALQTLPIVALSHIRYGRSLTR